MSRTRLGSLLVTFHRIQRRIEREHRALRPDWMLLLKLKKLRLATKDRIARLVKEARVSRRVKLAPPLVVRGRARAQSA